MRRILAILATVTMTGCASLAADIMTPGPKAETDPYDGATQVTQPPANASTASGPFVSLGMYWKSSTPDLVYVQPGVRGIRNVFDVDFTADGRRIEDAKPAQIFPDYGEMSSRAFAISYDEFRAIATAQTVRMKITTGSKHQVATFGQAHSSAMISHKLPEFLELVRQNRR